MALSGGDQLTNKGIFEYQKVHVNGKLVMGKLTTRQQGDRSKIHMDEAQEVKSWTHKLGVSREGLRKVVEKVGNSAAEVRKELDQS